MSLLALFLLAALSGRAQNGGVTTTRSFTYTGQIETWNVPAGVTSLTIEARGAEGPPNRNSGKGAILRGSVTVTPGQTLSVLVGQQPRDNRGVTTVGGGGGSFVVTTTSGALRPLVIAGGGGGGGNISQDSPTKHGQAGNAGGAATNSGGNGGSAGNGGRSGGGQYAASGGGGLLTDGGGSSGGRAFINGGRGGNQDQVSDNGGFGGGGASLVLIGNKGASLGGGGGGGYSGGGGASSNGDGTGGGYGGGGGSFNADPNGTAQTGATDGNTNDGLVIITYALPLTRRYVKQGGTGDGSSWATALGDLQAAINAPSVEEVWVATGVYYPTTGTNRRASFSLKSGVSVYGGFVGSEQNLNDRPAVNPVTGNPSSTTLSGDIGTRGNTADNSYIVVSNDGVGNTARLDGVVISGANNNDVRSNFGGGGMFNSNSSPRLFNCWITQNTVADLAGGGISNVESNPSLTNCLVSANSVTNGVGGGLYNNTSSPILINSVVAQNTAAQGGGLWNVDSYPTLTNCLLRGNTATTGGGVYNDRSTIRLVNCTFTGNQASTGAALTAYIATSNGTPSQVRLSNCILYNNQESTDASISKDSRSSVTAINSLIGQGETDYNANTNGNLTATTSPFVSDSDARLSGCAVAINAGSDSEYNAGAGPTTDLISQPRFYQNGPIDIGAYEYQNTPSQAVAITRQPASSSSVCAGSSVSVSVAASGTGPTYQWYKNGTPLTGNASATSATLTLGNVQSSDAGSYSVVVSGTCPGSVTSTAFNLIVTTPPTPTLLTQQGQSYPGGQSKVTVDVNSGNVNLVVGNCSNGTINWTGPNNTSGSSTPIVVSTDRVGTFVYQATCTVNGCTSPATSATVIVQGRVTVLHRDVDNYADNNAIQPLLQVQNNGTGPLPYSALTLRYYLTVEGNSPLANLFVNYAQVGGQNVRLRYVSLVPVRVDASATPLPPARQGATGYVEVSFTEAAGSLAPGANSGNLQLYFAKSDYGSLYEPDDYSYAQVRDQLVNNPRITAYYNGVLVAGTEPGEVAANLAVQALTESKNGPSATQINTYLVLRNTGNVAIPFTSIRARYYFTSDNNQTARVELDEGDVALRVVKLPAPVIGADSYVEVRYTGEGQLAPGASTGRVRYRVLRSDDGRFDQTNDYSYQEQPAELSPNNRVTVLIFNRLTWGTAPEGAPARMGVSEEPGSALSVRVLGNPLEGDQLRVEIRGAQGQPLQLSVSDVTGRVVSQQHIEAAGVVEEPSLSVSGSAAGLLLLQVRIPGQTQTLKVLKGR